jgi:serine phosphatase RsbU (regulator of sigma subunit)
VPPFPTHIFRIPLNRRLITIVFVFLCVADSLAVTSALKRDYKDWQTFLYKMYGKVFSDPAYARAKIDSMQQSAINRNDEEQLAHIYHINGLSMLYQNDDIGAHKLFLKGEHYFKEKLDFSSLGDYEVKKAILIMNKLRFKEAEKHLIKALWCYERSREDAFRIATYLKMGQLYLFDNRMPDAVKMYAKALKLSESLKDDYLIYESCLYLGRVMLDVNSLRKAEGYFMRARDISQGMRDSAMIASSAFYLSSYYHKTGEKVAEYRSVQKALNYIGNNINHPFYPTLCATKAGYYLNAGKPDSAISYANITISTFKAAVNYTGYLDGLNLKAQALFQKKNYKEALQIFKEGEPIIQQLGYTATASDIYKWAALSEYKTGSLNKAFEYFQKHVEIKDSVFTKESQTSVANIEAMFQEEKQQMQIEMLNRKNALRESELRGKVHQIKLQNQQKIWMSVALLVMVVLSFFIFKGYKRKKNDNELIAKQRDAMEHQKTLVEEKNREIFESISYAKYLQEAILPNPQEINSAFKEAFIFYQPKEIVAGDFYWLARHNNYLYFAVCDCTGHGVPGAMVSLVGNNSLNRCVKEFGLTNPGEILDKLTELIEETFSHSQKDIKDGMDISLCVLNIENRQLNWAGANNPIWLLKNGELTEIKANKQPIGRYENKTPFTTHEIKLQAGDCFYMFSDGYAHQFGGPKGKKFKYARLKELILQISNKGMDEQLQTLRNTFEDWRGSLDQIDDVCVAGVRI